MLDCDGNDGNCACTGYVVDEETYEDSCARCGHHEEEH